VPLFEAIVETDGRIMISGDPQSRCPIDAQKWHISDE
jgi:hypothetical protein